MVLVRAGQLRRWRGEPPTDSEAPVFVVLHPHKIPLPGSDWAENGWYILTEGRQCWVYEGDIEDDSDVLEDM